MNNKPDIINKLSNVLRSPLKLVGLVAIILVLVGVATAAWTYTTPPLFDCVANGTCYFGNMKMNGTTLIAQFFQGDASNLTAVPAAQLTGTAPLAAIPATLTGKDADTVDGYHMNQGVRTTDSPTFVTVNANVSGDNANMTWYNTTDGKQLSNVVSGASYTIVQGAGTVRDCGVVVLNCIKAINGSSWAVDYSGTNFKTVSENAANTLTAGRTWYGVLAYRGNFTGINDTTNIPNWTEIHASGAYFKLADNAGNINIFSRTDDSTHHIKIIGGTYDGNKANRATWSVLILGSSANGSDWLIDGATFRDSTGDGVFFVGAYKSIINSYFSGIDDTAIVFSGSLGYRVSNFTSAINNKIYDSNVAFALANDGGSITIANNHIVNMSQAAIGIEYTTGVNEPSDITIEGNTIRDVGANSAAILDENGTSGLKIINNNIKGQMRRGIAVGTGLIGGEGYHISGNMIDGYSYRECIRATLNNSIISNNICINASSLTDNTYSGIYLENSSWNIVEKNIFKSGSTNKPNYEIREIGVNSNANTFELNNVSSAGKILLVGSSSVQRNNRGTSPFDFGAVAMTGAVRILAFGANDIVINSSRPAVPNLCQSTAAGDNWVFAVNGTAGC